MTPELIVAIVAIVVAVLGIPATGFVTYRVVRRTERVSAAKRRRVVATGLLAELQSLELGLRKLASNKQAAVIRLIFLPRRAPSGDLPLAGETRTARSNPTGTTLLRCRTIDCANRGRSDLVRDEAAKPWEIAWGQ